MIIVRSKTEVSTSAVGVWEKGGVGVGVWESFRSITQQNMSCNVIMFQVSVLVMVFMYLWLGVFVVLCFISCVVGGVSVRTVGDVMSPSQEQMGVAPLSLLVSADSDP